MLSLGVQAHRRTYWLAVGAPSGAMGVLEDAMRSIFGDFRHKTNAAPELLVNQVPTDEAQIFAHTLRHLLLQHREQRLCLKRKVKVFMELTSR